MLDSTILIWQIKSLIFWSDLCGLGLEGTKMVNKTNLNTEVNICNDTSKSSFFLWYTLQFYWSQFAQERPHGILAKSNFNFENLKARSLKILEKPTCNHDGSLLTGISRLWIRATFLKKKDKQ